MSQRYRLFPLLFTENTSKNVNLWGSIIVLDRSLLPPTPPLLRNISAGFQINMININTQQIQIVFDINVDGFASKNAAKACR